MKTVTYQFLKEAHSHTFITECDEADTCPGCGAAYKVGLAACEYCRMPVVAQDPSGLMPPVAQDPSGQTPTSGQTPPSGAEGVVA